MELHYRGSFTYDELTHVFTHHYLPSPHTKIIRYFLVTLIISYVGYYFLFIYPDGLFSIAGVLVPTFLFLLIVTTPLFLPRINARNLINNTEFRFEFSGSITDQSVSIITQQSNSEIKWGIFKYYSQIDETILLYQTKNCFNIFPKRFFRSDEDWITFEKYVKGNIPKRKHGFGNRSS